MRFTELQDEYLQYLATQKGSSVNTIRTYRSAFNRCLEASTAIGVPEPDTEVVDRRWANHLVQELGKTLRPRTVRRNVTAWRSMLGYAVQEGYTERNPLAAVRLPKKDAVRRTQVTTDDLQRLLAATEKLYNTTRGIMAYALLLTAATAATRYSDLMPIRVSDLDLGSQMLLVRQGKGNKSRAIPLPKQTVAALEDWLEVRAHWLATWPKEDRSHRIPDALWLADRGRALGEGGLRKLMRELCRIAGIDHAITLHAIRHSAATRMARQGMPLVGIQAVLGHTNLTTTQTYIAGAGPHLQDWAEQMALPETPEEKAETSRTEPPGQSARFRRVSRARTRKPEQ